MKLVPRASVSLKVEAFLPPPMKTSPTAFILCQGWSFSLKVEAFLPPPHETSAYNLHSLSRLELFSQVNIEFDHAHHHNNLAGFCVDKIKHDNIHWSAPPLDSIKLNCDGSVCGFGARSTAGGVLRDPDGNFIIGFASGLGPWSVLEAEIQAIGIGIKLARLKGFRKVEIEIDSLMGCPFHQRWLFFPPSAFQPD